MGRPDEPTVTFIDKCVENERNTYKAFKVRPVSFLGGLQIFLMGILFPRKKNGFNPEFEDFFKDYETNNGREYGGYNKKDTIRTAIKKNKKAFEVLYNKHGILIFRRIMNAEMERLIGEDSKLNEIQSPYNGSVPDSDTIEEIYEKIMNELILPKLKMRITNAMGMISIPSANGSAPVSPSSEISSSINSPINQESSCDCNLLSEFGNTMNSTFRDLPLAISLGQAQSPSGQSLDQQVLTNNFIPEFGNTMNSTFRDLPLAISLGQAQSPSGKSLDQQVLTNNFTPEFGNTMNSTFRDLPPAISLEQAQSPSRQSLDQQVLTDNFIPEFGSVKNPSSVQNLPSTSSSVDQLTQTSQEQLSHELAIINDSIPENDRLLYDISKWYDELVNSKEEMNELKQPHEEAQKADHSGKTEKLGENTSSSAIDSILGNTICTPVLEVSSNTLDYDYSVPDCSLSENDCLLDNSSKWWEELLNSKEEMNELKQPHEEAQKVDHSEETGNSEADEQPITSNSCPHFDEWDNFESPFDHESSVTFSGKSDKNILEQDIVDFTEEYSGVPHPLKEEDKLILGVLKMKDIFQKYSSLTDIPTLRKKQRYPSAVEFSSVDFEIIETMDTSESDLLGMTSQDMDCSAETVPDSRCLETRRMFYPMFSILNIDSLNN